MSRFGFIPVIALVWLFCAGSVVLAQSPDFLRQYTVHIDWTPKQSWTGAGVHLGNGLILSAAHVVGGEWAKPRVEINGKYLKTKLLKIGDLATVDLALLSLDVHELPADRAGQHLSLCSEPYAPGQPVILAAPDGVARSTILLASDLPANVPAKFTLSAVDYVAPGNSGAGVFDAKSRCLLGIVSRKITATEHTEVNGNPHRAARDVAKYFVPSSEILAFLPAEVASSLRSTPAMPSEPPRLSMPRDEKR
jgi:trypsin-like peptidase